jgi:hypothetical protein
MAARAAKFLRIVIGVPASSGIQHAHKGASRLMLFHFFILHQQNFSRHPLYIDGMEVKTGRLTKKKIKQAATLSSLTLLWAFSSLSF